MPKITTPENSPSLSDVKADKPENDNLNENLPRAHVLRNILSFSASLKVEDSKHTGKIITHSN